MVDDAIVIVPKSKILDTFIADDEDTSIVIAFLQQHDDIFKDICSTSIYWNRIFQLDYFLKSNKIGRDYILSKLNDIDIKVKAYFIWQILLSNSFKANETKYKCRKMLDEIWKASHVKHPHSFSCNGIFKKLDVECAEFSSKDCLLTIPMTLSKNDFEQVFNGIEHSLFSARLLQYDVFAAIDTYKQFIMMSNALHLKNGKLDINCLRFFLQVLDSGEDDKVKLEFYKKFYDTITATPQDFLSDTVSSDIMQMIYDCSSGEEFIMKMTIFGNEMTPYVILQLLALRPNWIKAWAKIDKDGLNSILNISAIADSLDK